MPGNCRFPKKKKNERGREGEWNKLLSGIVNWNGKSEGGTIDVHCIWNLIWTKMNFSLGNP